MGVAQQHPNLVVGTGSQVRMVIVSRTLLRSHVC
jgi:hypothetical protein